MKFRKLKLPRKLNLPKLPIRWVLGYLIALAPVIRLARLYDTNPTQFWVEAPFLISSFAAIFAGISALLALRSLKVTEQALELTRSTTRPFLALQPGEAFADMKEHIATLEIQIRNTGSMPANLVTAELAFFDEGEQITETNESKEYPKESESPRHLVIFPNYAYQLVHRFDLSRGIDTKLFENMKNGKVYWRVRITYTGQGTEYVTVQTEKIEKAEAGKMTRIPIEPQRHT